MPTALKNSALGTLKNLVRYSKSYQQHSYLAMCFVFLGTAPVQRPRQSLPPSTTMEPEWPSLPSQQQHTAMAAGPKPSAWVQPVQKPKPFPPSNQQQHTPQFPPPRISRNFTAPGATFTPLPHPSRNRYASFPSADRSTTHNQQQYGAAVVSPPANVFKQRHFPMPQQPPVSVH